MRITPTLTRTRTRTRPEPEPEPEPEPGAYREASLVALHGTPTLALAPGAAAVAVGAGEARALSIGREHVIGCRGDDHDAPCSWLYAMR